MTARAVILTVTVLALAGCRKPPASNAIPGAGPGVPSAAAPTATATDYTKLTPTALESFIAQKLGGPITLKAAGGNKYTGTRPSPDGTLQIPVTVTVEANRIVIESQGGGLSSRDVIDANGRLQSSDLR